MKKVFVVMLSLGLVLAMAASAMAAVTISGDFGIKIMGVDESKTDKSLPYNKMDGSIKIANKFNENLSTTVKVKYDTTKPFSSEGNGEFDDLYTDEVSGQLSYDWGKMKVGQFPTQLYRLDILDQSNSTMDKLYNTSAIQYGLPKTLLPDGFATDITYFKVGTAAKTTKSFGNKINLVINLIQESLYKNVCSC